MKKTLLKFTSSIYLLAFRKYSKASQWEINLSELTVLCNCSDKEAKIACNDFNAVILNQDEAVSTYELIKDAGMNTISFQLTS